MDNYGLLRGADDSIVKGLGEDDGGDSHLD